MRPFGLIAMNHGSFCVFFEMSIFVTLRSVSAAQAVRAVGRTHIAGRMRP
jgi:CelD/BcsL family acetyltransferase involved in cellulose biosynthesis